MEKTYSIQIVEGYLLRTHARTHTQISYQKRDDVTLNTYH